jgi:hypothetical protein
MCAFPFHLWTLIMVFRDISWVTERTNAWDAVGVAAYGLLLALAESILVFLILTALGFIMPKQWTVDKRIAFLSLIVLIIAVWGILSQLFFLWNINLPIQTMQSLARSVHPLWWLYGGTLVIVIPTVFLPVYFFLRTDKVFLFMQGLIERLSTLTMLYLFFDLIGLIVAIIRNIG